MNSLSFMIGVGSIAGCLSMLIFPRRRRDEGEARMIVERFHRRLPLAAAAREP